MNKMTEEGVMGNIIRAAFSVLHELEGTSSSNTKFAILEENKHNEILKAIFFATYGGDKYHCHPELPVRTEFMRPETLEDNWKEFLCLLSDLRMRNVTGNDALDRCEAFFNKLSAVEHHWYRRVLGHDLDIGLTMRTLSKVYDFKGYTLGDSSKVKQEVEFPGVMLCKEKMPAIEKLLKSGNTLFVEDKLDGYRLMLVINNGKFSFFSRAGKSDYYNINLRHIADALMSVCASGIFDGEIMHNDWNLTGVIKHKNPTKEHMEDIRKNVKFHLFDHLINPGDMTPLWIRRKRLEEFVDKLSGVSCITTTRCSKVDKPTFEVLSVVYEAALAAGYEGVIIKDSTSVYQHDKRSANWVKLKPVDTTDVRVLSAVKGESTGRFANVLGGFVVQDSTGTTFNCGGGYTEAQREEFWRDRDSYIGKWMEIAYQRDGVTTGAARFPRFIRWRTDING